MTDNFWKDKYPVGVASEINPDEYQNIQAVLKQSCERFADKPAFSNLGKTLTYGELYKLSGDFAAYLQQNTDLQPGDRIAVQLPNLIQYPIVVFGAMRAGLIVVNTNPLYTAREMEHQFNDAGAKALVCLANMAHLAEEVLPKTGIKHVVITEVADMLPPLKRMLINAVVKHVKKMVPAYSLPKAVKLNDALALGRGKAVREASPKSEDVAVLQYTGGTTGVAKGAMLTHRNIVANMLQCKALMGANLNDGSEVLIAPLPLYHIYAFTFHCMAMMLSGNHNILISNPRDLPAMIKDLGKYRFSGFVGSTPCSSRCATAKTSASSISRRSRSPCRAGWRCSWPRPSAGSRSPAVRSAKATASPKPVRWPRSTPSSTSTRLHRHSGALHAVQGHQR